MERSDAPAKRSGTEEEREEEEGMRKALIPAFLLVLGAVVLGSTLFREQLARAATPFTNVIVGNTSTNPVPVQQQGTANVNVTNRSLTVASPTPVTGGGNDVFLNAPGGGNFTAATATALVIQMGSAVGEVVFKDGNATVAAFEGPAQGGSSEIDLSLNRPITFDQISVAGSGPTSVSWIGNSP